MLNFMYVTLLFIMVTMGQQTHTVDPAFSGTICYSAGGCLNVATVIQGHDNIDLRGLPDSCNTFQINEATFSINEIIIDKDMNIVLSSAATGLTTISLIAAPNYSLVITDNINSRTSAGINISGLGVRELTVNAQARFGTLEVTKLNLAVSSRFNNGILAQQIEVDNALTLNKVHVDGILSMNGVYTIIKCGGICSFNPDYEFTFTGFTETQFFATSSVAFNIVTATVVNPPDGLMHLYNTLPEYAKTYVKASNTAVYLRRSCGNNLIESDFSEVCDNTGDANCVHCDCREDYVYEGTRNLCIPVCPSVGCISCLTPNVCASCATGYLNPESGCNVCDVGYDNSTENQCTFKCDSDYCPVADCFGPNKCNQCTHVGADPTTGCLSCITGYRQIGEMNSMTCEPICENPLCQNCTSPNVCASCSNYGNNPNFGCNTCIDEYRLTANGTCVATCNHIGCPGVDCNGLSCNVECVRGYLNPDYGCFVCDEGYSESTVGDETYCTPICNLDHGVPNPFCVECVEPNTCTSCTTDANGSPMEDLTCQPKCDNYKNNTNSCVECIGNNICSDCLPAFASPETGCNICHPQNGKGVYPDCKRNCGQYCESCLSETDRSIDQCFECIKVGSYTNALVLEKNCRYCDGQSFIGTAPNCVKRKSAGIRVEAIASIFMIIVCIIVFL